MEVKIWTQNLSQPITITAMSTYQKGDMFCVEWMDGCVRMVDKYPFKTIFRVRETYYPKAK